jgi:hypothetical protein
MLPRKAAKQIFGDKRLSNLQDHVFFREQYSLPGATLPQRGVEIALGFCYPFNRCRLHKAPAPAR